MIQYSYGKYPPVAEFTQSESAFATALSKLSATTEFSRIKVVKLIELSGYSKGSFYNNFNDKYDFAKKILLQTGLNHHYYLRECQKLIDNGAGKDDPEFIELSCDFFRFIYNHHDIYDMLIEQKLGDQSLEWFCSQLTEDSRQIMTHDSMMDAKLGASVSLVYIIMWRSIGYDNASPEYMVELTSRFFPMFSAYFKGFII